MANTANLPKTNLFRRFVDEGSTLLGHALGTKEGRDIYASAREAIEQDDIFFVYDVAYNALLDYTEKHSLTPGDAQIIAWAMIEKALTECIQKELSE